MTPKTLLPKFKDMLAGLFKMPKLSNFGSLPVPKNDIAQATIDNFPEWLSGWEEKYYRLLEEQTFDELHEAALWIDSLLTLPLCRRCGHASHNWQCTKKVEWPHPGGGVVTGPCPCGGPR